METNLMNTIFAPRPKELDPVEGVNWGNRCSLRIVSGPTYHDIELVTNITNPADIERVEVTLNGSPIISCSGEALEMMQLHRKNYVQDGRYVISFGDATLRTKAGVRMSDLVTLPGEIWFVYIQLKETPSASAPTIPTIRARAHVLPAQSERFYMPRIKQLTWHAAAAGRTPFDYPERSPFINIRRIHMSDPTDSIDRVRVIRDNVEELNVRRADNDFDLLVAKKDPIPGWLSLNFIRYGFGAEGVLNTAARSQLQFELDKSAPGSIPVLIEFVEQVKPFPSQVAA
ncbi:major capsid protein P2 [Photobacterium salinisoli]|uniref:major capsid protein P2 n=1 Tax=Photobacterium salinisoli TaxID=1616783 RepID=UPI000EA0CCF6|nr:major capsid protein P2 [Photobacterium salinisoli]